MKNFDGKDMEVWLKRGWVIADFIQNLECTEDEFLSALQKNFEPKAYKSMIGRLKTNQKRRGKAMKPRRQVSKVKQVSKVHQPVNEVIEKSEIRETNQTNEVDFEKITVFVYENGEIDIVESAEKVEIPEWEDAFKELAEYDESVEDLTIKQIKQLAKVIALVRTVDKKVEVTFEVEAIQQVFEQMQ